jgi:two-component system, NtrC family, sensor kinase
MLRELDRFIAASENTRPEQGKIFEPLFSTKNGKGAGLGLWVAHRLVLQQHGQIRLVSGSEGMHSGACFSVFLPLRPN